MLEYLIHLNNSDKTQYNVKEVHGELATELANIIEQRKTEEEKLQPIIEAIEEYKIATVMDLMKYANKQKKSQIIRKYQYILIKMLEEKKYEILQRRNRK